MAQLNSRGTLTRARWDYFEHSNGWAFVYGNVLSGEIAAYFVNNATGTSQIDLYHLSWSASISISWFIALIPPPLVLTPLTPTETEVHAIQLDSATPPGTCGMYIAAGPNAYTLQRVSNATNTGTIAPVAGEPFLTLPPGWAISVGGNAGSNPCELSMTLWFQPVLDNVAPAQ